MKNLLYGSVYGSHLYGVSNPESDFDYKYVYACPDTLSYLRGETKVQNTIGEVEHLGKMTRVETEYFHVQDYARLLGQAQSIAIEILFSPIWAWRIITPEWQELQANYQKAVSRDIGPFVGYARSQAVKYSLKGEKIATLEIFLKWVDGKNRVPTTEDFKELQDLLQGRAGVRLWTDTKTPTLREPIRLIDICGRSFGETTHFKIWKEASEKIYNEYGVRAREAHATGGRDLKAMYHAVRIVSQAIELLTTGRLTFPRPEAPLLLDIRNGLLSNDEVADVISDRMALMEQAQLDSKLPSKSDKDWIQDWAIQAQRNQFMKEIGVD